MPTNSELDQKEMGFEESSQTSIRVSVEGRREACIKSIETIEKRNIGCLTTQNVETQKSLYDITVKSKSNSTYIQQLFRLDTIHFNLFSKTIWSRVTIM